MFGFARSGFGGRNEADRCISSPPPSSSFSLRFGGPVAPPRSYFPIAAPIQASKRRPDQGTTKLWTQTQQPEEELGNWRQNLGRDHPDKMSMTGSGLWDGAIWTPRGARTKPNDASHHEQSQGQGTCGAHAAFAGTVESHERDPGGSSHALL